MHVWGTFQKFGFVEREKINRTFLKNRCGRDFLYYALHYYYPEDFNSHHNNPEEIEAKRLFGKSVPAVFAWSQLQFISLPKFLRSKSLSLKISNRQINSFKDFFNAILFSRITYPFSLPIIQNLPDIIFSHQVTFIVGENGTGKSTILEAIASKSGFGKEGGSKNLHFETADAEYGNTADSLAKYMKFVWRKKPRDGYFFRAESFFNVANNLDEMSKHPMVGDNAYIGYGGGDVEKCLRFGVPSRYIAK